MRNQVTVSLTLNEIAQTLGSYYRLYNRQKAIAGERRDSGEPFEAVESVERLASTLQSQIDAIESMLSQQCGLLFEHFTEAAPVHQVKEVAVSGYNPYSADGVFTIYSRDEDIIAEKRREIERAAAQVETPENGTRPDAMPLGDMLAERFRHPGAAVSGNPSQTPSHDTGEAD